MIQAQTLDRCHDGNAMRSADDDSTADAGGEALRTQHAAARVSIVFYHREGTALLELREPDAAVVGRAFPADLIIAEPSLSRLHARFSWAAGTLTVTDLESKNGTRLRGQLIKETRVHSGDELSLGDVIATAHVLPTPDVVASGIDGYDRVTRRLREEVLRAREFGRSLALLMVRAAEERSAHVGHFIAGLAPRLRSVDALGIYDDRTAIVILPELSGEAALAAAQRVLAARPAGELVAGLALYPHTASSDEELLAVARRSCRAAQAGQPLHTAEPSYEAPASVGQTELVLDPSMLALYRTLRQIAPRGLPVLITGETGVGKEVIAAALHRASGRTGPLKVINCATIPVQLTESILFGHERGAFTSAARRATGLFEEAQGGTVFLDEVGELSATAQAALLRVLQEKRIVRVGSTREIDVDVRIVAATHRDLDAMVHAGAFRKDLLYRLNAVTLDVPPLRERPAEIAALARLFLNSAIAEWGGMGRRLSPEVVSVLEAYDWPGNVRQLRNVIERAAALCDREQIEAIDLPNTLRSAAAQRSGDAAAIATIAPPFVPDADEPSGAAEEAFFWERVREFETELIQQALGQAKGNVKRASELLRMPLRTLTYKLKALGIKAK
jgi:DNA-binding NtrC family response regulator